MELKLIILTLLLCPAEAEDFITVFVDSAVSRSIQAVSGETRGWIQLQSRPREILGSNVKRDIEIPQSFGVTNGIENKSLLVSTSDSSVNIYSRHSDTYFSPLPIYGLGNTYVVSSCPSNHGNSFTLLIIASHINVTDVRVTFKVNGNVTYDGKTYSDRDTLTFSLERYQTWTIRCKCDLTGTTVRASSTVAVFSGTFLAVYATTFDQLLPVRHHGYEYVVAVDDNPALYKLQTVSKFHDAKIFFRNGITGFVNEQFTIGQSGILYFTSTRPVMTTLCRRVLTEYTSGFAVVPPVSYGTNRSAVYIQRGNVVKVLSENNNDVQVRRTTMSSISVEWQGIPGTRFQVGTFTASSSTYLISSEKSRFTFCVYHTDYFYSGGLSFHNSVSTREDYIVVFFGWFFSDSLRAVSAETPGWVQLQSRPREILGSYMMRDVEISPSLGVREGIETKSLLVSASDSTLNIYSVQDQTHMSPLPISCLGKKYIVSSCNHAHPESLTLLVVANHINMTDVRITFKVKGNVTYDGKTYSDRDTLIFSLERYQTWTIQCKCDLTGTTIGASNTVAVFSGAIVDRYKTTLDQLLPVRYHGHQYVVAVDDNPAMYHLQIVSEFHDVQVTLSNGTTVFVNEQFTIGQTEILYFTSTRPVMTTLCRKTKYSVGFAVVPPVSYSTNRRAVYIRRGSVVKVLSENNNDVQVRRTKLSSISVEWQGIPGTRFQVGTFGADYDSTYLISSENSRFTFFVYHNRYFYSGGLSFVNDTPYTAVFTQTAFTSTSERTEAPAVTTFISSEVSQSSQTTNSRMETTPVITDTNMETPQNTMAVIVAATCGSVIAILITVVTTLVVYIRRLKGANKALRETTSVDHRSVTNDDAVARGNHLYEEFDMENNTVNDYDKIADTRTKPDPHYENVTTVQ